MEEQQIQEFVHRVLADEQARYELMRNPEDVIKRQGFSPRVERILALLVPHLAFDETIQLIAKWWHV